MKNKSTLSMIAGGLVSVAALYLAFRNVPFGDLISYFSALDWFWTLAAALLVMATFFLRALRWKLILGPSHRIGLKSAYHPLMIGFMLNCILPGRVGELARPVILKKQEGVAFTTGLATVAAERIFDLILLLLMFIIVMATVPIDPALEISFGKYSLTRDTLVGIGNGMARLGLVLIIAIASVSIEKSRRVFIAVVRAMPRLLFFAGDELKAKFSQKVCEPVVAMLANIALGFETVKQPWRLLGCFLLSAAVWGLAALSYHLVVAATPSLDLTLGQTTVVMIIICFFIALPSVPGFWGIWEAGGVFAMALFGVPSVQAAGFALASHVIQMFPVIIAGLVSALITGVNLRQVTVSTESEAPRG